MICYISLERDVRLVMQNPEHQQTDLLLICYVDMSPSLRFNQPLGLQVFVVSLVSGFHLVSEALEIRGRLLFEVLGVESLPGLGARVLLLELGPLGHQLVVVEDPLQYDDRVGVLVVVHLEQLLHVAIAPLDELLHLVLHELELQFLVLNAFFSVL